MGTDRPDDHTLQFGCDVCDEVIEFVAQDEGVSDPPSFIASWQSAKAQGWISQKPVGFGWQYFCPACAPAAQRDSEARRERERERQRMIDAISRRG